jgi:hypothetical protein
MGTVYSPLRRSELPSPASTASNERPTLLTETKWLIRYGDAESFALGCLAPSI